MNCLVCPLKYDGQTGRTFNTRCKVHIHAIRSYNASTETQHLCIQEKIKDQNILKNIYFILQGAAAAHKYRKRDCI
jgi:hypothetical protein